VINTFRYKKKAHKVNLTVVCESFDRSSILLQPWRYVYEISRRIAARGVLVTVISDTDSAQPETEEIEKIKVSRIGHPLLMTLFRKGEFVKAILKNEPDIVVWHGTPLGAFYLSRLKAVKKPMVWIIDSDLGSLQVLNRVSIREIFDLQNSSLWIQMLTALLPRYVIKRVANSTLISKIVVPTDYLETCLRKIGVDASKITVVPSTLEKEDDLKIPTSPQSIDRLKEDIGFKADDFLVTYFGSPSTLRGTDTVVRSVPQTLGKVGNLKLVILSRRKPAKPNAEHEYFEHEEMRLKKLIRDLGIEEHVKIIPGTQDKSRLRQYLCASDIIALPFKIIFSDPPLSVLEAMSLGKAVVTTNVGSLSDIVHHDRGVLIEPSHPDALAQAVIYLAEHQEERLWLGQNAQRFAANLPDWDLVARKFTSLMEEIYDKNSKS